MLNHFKKQRFIVPFVILLFLIGCKQDDLIIVPGQIYNIQTKKDGGYAIFETNVNGSWVGTYYVDNKELYAIKKSISLTSKRLRSFLIEGSSCKKTSVKSISLYEKPSFKDYPKTWTYKDSIYGVSVHNDVVYGRVKGYWTSLPGRDDDPFIDIYISKILDKYKKDLLLMMDVYTPCDDNLTLRPLLVLIHGGGFYCGDKKATGFPEMAKYYASLGYLVVSVNYRLGFYLNRESVEKAGYHAVQDVNAAIRFLLHNKKEFNVDPDRVFVAGCSAGGITALNLAFMHDVNIPLSAEDEGPIQAVNPDMKEKYSIRAVCNMWGAVTNLQMINNEDVSIIAFHSTDDPVVPFGEGYPFRKIFGKEFLFPKMYGSGEITDYIKKLGRNGHLCKYDIFDKHSIYLNGNRLNEIFYEIEHNTRDFFADVMLPHKVKIERFGDSPVFGIDSTDVYHSFWKIEGGVITDIERNKVRVLLFPDSSIHNITVCGQYKSKLSFRETENI